MFGPQKLKAPQNMRNSPAQTVQTQARSKPSAINPEVTANRQRTTNKFTFKASVTQLRTTFNPPKKINAEPRGIDRYKVNPTQKKEEFSEERAFISRPAPSNQFKKYLSDGENVFYEDSPQMRKLRIIKSAKLYLTIFVIFMSISYVGIGRIVPFPKGKCPPHAVCNVFIHCHKGYARRNNTCIIDPQIVNKAKEISEAVVSQLSYNLGDSECLNEAQPSDSIKIQDVFREFNVEDEMLINQIIYFFVSRQNQVTYDFSYRLNTITARSKLYSLSCSTSLFIRSPDFKYYFLGLVALIFVSVKLIRIYLFSRSAKLTYQFLKKRTMADSTLCVNHVKRQAEALYGRWTTELWSEVDVVRAKDGYIAYYIDMQQVYWKRLD